MLLHLNIISLLPTVRHLFTYNLTFLFRYHIPRSLLKSTGNLLVLLEEETGNPLAITLDTVYITSQ